VSYTACTAWFTASVSDGRHRRLMLSRIAMNSGICTSMKLWTAAPVGFATTSCALLVIFS
jgi:hypothetical protein